MPAARKPPPPKPAPRPPPKPPPPKPAPKPPAPKPAPKPPPAKPAPKPAARAPAPKPAARPAVKPAAKPVKPKPAPKPAKAVAARAPRPAPAKPKPKPKPAKPKPKTKTPAKAKPKPKGKAKPAANVKWWNVTASREVMGGTGACRVIEPRGYSELSTNPTAAHLDFAALGDIPCLTGLYLRNPANGKTVGAVKQDKGAGSTGFHASMGLYPQTITDLSLGSGGEFHIQIRRQDGVALHIPGAVATTLPAADDTSPSTSAPSSAYVNPLLHANVTAGRVDQGVDYTGTGYLVAIADSVVTSMTPNGSGWEGEGYVEYQITQDGELKDVFVYYAEGVNPTVQEGDVLHAGDKVADLRDPMPHGIEIGFAAGAHQQSYYRYHDGTYDEHSSTRPGIAFNNLIKRLNGPGGVVSSDVTGNFPEYMQSGEPAPAVTQTTPGPDSPITGLPTPSIQSADSVYDFADSFGSAFIQLQRGATEAHDHTNATKTWAEGITYVAKSD